MTRLILAMALLATGCVPRGTDPDVDLVDPRTVWPKVEAPGPGQVRNLPPLPLAVLRFNAGAPDMTAALARSVAETLLRKPEAEFDVITPVESGGTPSPAQAQDATDVAHVIAEQSVPTEHIHIGAAEEANAAAREVRVFVR